MRVWIGGVRAGRGGERDGRRALATITVALSAAVGVVVLLGCLLALYLEFEGFGSPRDSGVRPWYVAGLVAGAVAATGLPVLGTAVLRPEALRRVSIAAACVGLATVLVAIVVLGVI